MSNFLNYLILGGAQGIFEWLPISSEGIVAFLSKVVLGMKSNPVDLALFLHLGTLLAVLIFFRKEWLKLLSFKKKKLLRFIVFVTIISLGLGYFLYERIRNIKTGAGLLLIMGVGLLLTSYFHKKKSKKVLKEVPSIIITGILQGLSVIPGVSRSGSTFFGLSLKEEKPTEILKVSYLLSLPVVLAFSGYLLLNNPSLASQSWPALLTSFLVGIVTLKLLFSFAEKINFAKFTFVFGTLCIISSLISFL